MCLPYSLLILLQLRVRKNIYHPMLIVDTDKLDTDCVVCNRLVLSYFCRRLLQLLGRRLLVSPVTETLLTENITSWSCFCITGHFIHLLLLLSLLSLNRAYRHSAQTYVYLNTNANGHTHTKTRHEPIQREWKGNHV